MVNFKIGYSLREASQHFNRNLSTSIAAVITIFLSLSIIGIFSVGGLMITSAVGTIESRVLIQAFLSPDAEQADIQTVMDDMKTHQDVSDVSFKDRDQALTEYRESHGNSSSTADAIAQLDGQNPLPASLVIELKNPQNVQDVANTLIANPTFARIAEATENPELSVQYGEEAVERLFALTNYARFIGIVLVGLLTFIALVFINNTIRLSILARRREIGIMRLVGASNSFIRGPFVMEGLFQAILGSALAIGSIELIRRLVLPRVQESLQFLTFTVSSADYLRVYALLASVGIIIGLVGSALAMRRYLKV